MSQLNKISIKIGAQGRFVIPAMLRSAMGLSDTSTLLAHVENGQLILAPQTSPFSRLQALCAQANHKLDLQKIKSPESLSPSEALIQERRAEAIREYA